MHVQLKFPCTNNVAEYETCIITLQTALDMKIKDFELYGDSILIILQVNGEWTIKSPELVKYNKCLIHMKDMFQFISSHICQEP